MFPLDGTAQPDSALSFLVFQKSRTVPGTSFMVCTLAEAAVYSYEHLEGNSPDLAKTSSWIQGCSHYILVVEDRCDLTSVPFSHERDFSGTPFLIWHKLPLGLSRCFSNSRNDQFEPDRSSDP